MKSGDAAELLERAIRLRKADPEALAAIYIELFNYFASVADTPTTEMLVNRIRKAALAHPRWRNAVFSLAARLLSKGSDDGASPEALALLRSGQRLSQPLPYAGAQIQFGISSEQEFTQVRGFSKRERETQRWIEGFSQGDVFYDVGANIGLFTLLAACQPDKDLTVVAFEPTYASLHSLCVNLTLNEVSERVIPLLCGLSDVSEIERLNLKRLEPGTAKSVVGEALDFRNMPFRPVAVHNVPVFRLDDAVSWLNLPVPNHIKIDVDGIEMKVLAGAMETLAKPEVRSIMVEAASVEMEEELKDILGGLGFSVFMKADKQLGALEEGHTRNNYFRR